MLLTFEAYETLLGVDVSDRLAEPGGEDVELVIRAPGDLPEPATFG